MIRRDAYEAVGGHASVSGEVLEDVALATRVKIAGYRIWFGSGKGIVRVRMYRSFGAMWEGWKKNLYRLMGGNAEAMGKEIGGSAVAGIGGVDGNDHGLGIYRIGGGGLAMLGVGNPGYLCGF